MMSLAYLTFYKCRLPTNAYSSSISGYTNELFRWKFFKITNVNATSYSAETFAAGEILVAAIEQVAANNGGSASQIFDAAYMTDFIKSRSWSTVLARDDLTFSTDKKQSVTKWLLSQNVPGEPFKFISDYSDLVYPMPTWEKREGNETTNDACPPLQPCNLTCTSDSPSDSSWHPCTSTSTLNSNQITFSSLEFTLDADGKFGNLMMTDMSPDLSKKFRKISVKLMKGNKKFEASSYPDSPLLFPIAFDMSGLDFVYNRIKVYFHGFIRINKKKKLSKLFCVHQKM